MKRHKNREHSHRNNKEKWLKENVPTISQALITPNKAAVYLSLIRKIKA
jgi:hypothetical protein